MHDMNSRVPSIARLGRLVRRLNPRILWSAVAIGMFVSPCRADTTSLGGVLQDAGLYFTAPLRWDESDWLQFGASVAAIGVAHELDGRVRSHFVGAGDPSLDRQDRHNLRDLVPAAAMIGGTWLGAVGLGDRAGYEEGREMLEAGALSALTTELFKAAAGRLRPNESTTPDHWREGGDSFPSRHVSVTFAVGTILAESGGDDFRWIRRVLGYGLSAATVYARLHENQHWLSDTVAGAALGIATAQFAMHRGAAVHTDSGLSLAPLPGGLFVQYRLVLN